MTKFLPTQDVTDEKGVAILKKVLTGPFFLPQEWGVKDKYPDIDGQIRLRDGKNTYLNKYLHYQLKSVGKIKSQKYSCAKKDLEYMMDSNVPTLLFVVDVEREKVFWFFAKRDFQGDLTAKTKSFTLDLGTFEINNNFPELQSIW